MDDDEQRQTYQMVALDLDGTLLQPNRQISEETVRYLRYLHIKGFIVSIATGRSYVSTIEHAQKLNFSYQQSSSCTGPKLPCSITGIPVVSMNGAVGVQLVKCPDDSTFKVKELFRQSLSEDITIKALSLSKQLDFCCQLYFDDKIYTNPSTDPQFSIIRRFSKITGIQQIQCDDDFAGIMKEKGSPIRLVIMCGEEAIDNTMDFLTKAFGNDAYIVRGGRTGWFVEILMKGVNKGSGLERMCREMNLNTNDTVAFGDGYNDIEFLQIAGLGIAMKNSPSAIKEIADTVTEFTNAEDGVRLKLEEMEEKELLKFST